MARHLPDSPSRQVAEQLTIQQLATHTAGLGDIFTEEEPEETGFGIGVAGGAPGVSAEFEMGGPCTVVVLSHLDPPSAARVARHLRELIESVTD